MIENYVVVIRLKEDADVVGILISETDDMIKLQHPHFAKYSAATNGFLMIPYCMLSDETYFEFKRDRIEFLVTASKLVTKRFLSLLEPPQVAEPIEEDLQESFSSTWMDGNSTKH